MRRSTVLLVYLLFFLSGAAALMYQVVWVRSLSLVFGGSHLAVATVLSVFMGGLALGGHVFGRRAERHPRPLVLYGLLELGIAGGALLFLAMIRLYPAAYVWLAGGRDGAVAFLSAVRVLFAVLALALPTTLMGGTLPALARVASSGGVELGRRLSFLYAWNTFGAVVGAATTGFVLLPRVPVSATLWLAVAANVAIGLVSVVAGRRLPGGAAAAAPADATAPGGEPSSPVAARLALLGIGASGFCALGYEVLWTRTLSMVVGASVYGFTTMLVAFLTGIGLGSKAYGLVSGRVAARSPRAPLALFGIVQLAIGATALLVTLQLRELPQVAIAVRAALQQAGVEHESVRTWGGLAVAFAHMVVPAFFMGVAFPLAAQVHARHAGRVASAVGEVLAWNTVGAILGSLAAGFVLVHAVGAERSLHLLALLNAGVGVAALVARRGWRAPALALAATAAVMAALAALPGLGKAWDTQFFAIYRNNQTEAFRSPEAIHEALENTDVLYWAEGADANISSIRVKGGHQAVLVNGKVVASTEPKDLQCQYTLGHVPMLLHPDPRRVLVVGLGTGMTLGATAVHPAVRELVLVEIEPRVEGAARTFARFNHDVLDDPRLERVHGDGRNYLLTTRRRFDVITADPIHPWAQGAAYLYTDEYFALAASRLAPGGIMVQWLPIYELTPDDLRTVAATFARHFRHVLVWLTHNDAELVGSNDPFDLDPALLERRLEAAPLARADLASVDMGSARDALSYVLAGGDGVRAFAAGAVVNTDDNLRLEFSAPRSVGKFLIPENLRALYAHQEPLAGVVPPEAARLRAAAHVALYADPEGAEAAARIDALRTAFPDFAPGRYLARERGEWLERQPSLLAGKRYPVLDAGGAATLLPFAAVWAPVSRTRGSVMFVDAARREVFGQRYFEGATCREDGARFGAETLARADGAYARATEAARRAGRAHPGEAEVLAALRGVVAARTGGATQ